MEEHNYDSKQLKEREKYAFIFITIAVAFGLFSCLILMYGHGKSNALNTVYIAVYAAFFSIIGGLIGGLITLEGVRRTVYAQKDIESKKLIPNKVVHLHKLKREIKPLETFRKDIEFIRSELNHYKQIDYRNASNDDMSLLLIKIIPFYKNLLTHASKSFEDKEEELVKTVAQIDLKMYHKVVQLFKELNGEFKLLKEAVNAVEINLHFPDENLGTIRSVITIYDKFISIDGNGDIKGTETFVNTMKRGQLNFREKSMVKKPSMAIVNQILEVVPNLQTIVNSLDNRIDELKGMKEQRLDKYEQFEETIL